MKSLSGFALVTFLLVSCGPKSYMYKFQMTHPVSSNNLSYSNDTFDIAFNIKPQFIEFDIYNKSNDGLKINWDEVSLALNGQAKRVVHKETGIYKTTDVQPPTTIPPHAKLNDAIIPTDNISRFGSSTTYKSMFPVSVQQNKKADQRIMDLKGQRLTIYLPFYSGNTFISKYYNIDVVDVEKVKGTPKTSKERAQ